MTGARIRPGAVLSDTWLLCARHAVLVGASSMLLFVLGMGVDLAPWPDLSPFFGFVFGLIAAYVQLLLVAQGLRGLGLLPPDADPRRPTLGRYPASILLGIIYSLGVLAGLVLLVIPGLVLAFRWYLALPAMVAEERRAADALRRSWELTSGHFALLAQIGALVTALWLATLLICLHYPDYFPIPLRLAFLFNAAWSLTLVLTSMLSVAFYAQIASRGGNRAAAAPPA